MKNICPYTLEFKEHLEKLKLAIKFIDKASELEHFKSIIVIYKKCIESACRALRRRLLYQQNLFISNPVYIIEYSYALNLIIDKDNWIKALKSYDYVTYLIPDKDMTYDVYTKIKQASEYLLLEESQL